MIFGGVKEGGRLFITSQRRKPEESYGKLRKDSYSLDIFEGRQISLF